MGRQCELAERHDKHWHSALPFLRRGHPEGAKMKDLDRIDHAWRMARAHNLTFEQWRALANGQPMPAPKSSVWRRIADVIRRAPR